MANTDIVNDKNDPVYDPNMDNVANNATVVTPPTPAPVVDDNKVDPIDPEDDVNNDGIVDGSPQSVAKLFQDIFGSIADVFHSDEEDKPDVNTGMTSEELAESIKEYIDKLVEKSKK